MGNITDKYQGLELDLALPHSDVINEVFPILPPELYVLDFERKCNYFNDCVFAFECDLRRIYEVSIDQDDILAYFECEDIYLDLDTATKEDIQSLKDAAQYIYERYQTGTTNYNITIKLLK